MKKLLTLTAIVLILTGCESTKYGFRQMFGTSEQQREYGTFQSKNEDPNASAAASADDWVKKRLW